MADVTPFNPALRGGLLPPMPRELELQVETLRQGGSRYASGGPGDAGLFLPAPPPKFHPKAAELLALVEARCRPATLDFVAAWLGRLALGLGNPPSDRGGIGTRIELLGEACEDIPAGVFCRETLIEARRAYTLWPSIAEMYALLKPHADRLTGSRDALQRIVAAGDQQPPTSRPEQPPPPDNEARRYVRALVAAFQPERSADDAKDSG